MRRKSKRKLLTLDVIRAASKGDYEAMDIVLRHYEGYMTLRQAASSQRAYMRVGRQAEVRR